MAWKSTNNTAPCHIWHAFPRGPSWNWVEDTWNSRKFDDGIADCLANGSVNRQARASPAFRDGRKAPRWKANLDREIFRTLLTTSHAGAGTEPYNRQATAGPHRKGWCVTTGGKVYSALVAETCQCSLGMARRVSCPDRVFAHDGLVRLAASTNESQAPATGLHLHLGVQ